MAITVSFMLQKGGVGKSTTTGLLAYLLGRRGKRVLVADMDSQGNVSTLLSRRSIYTFSNETILEAIEDQDAAPYIVPCEDNVDLLPADDLLGIYSRRLQELHAEKQIPGPPVLYLKRMLETIGNQYDYIFIDCPPSLNDQTISALSASNYVVAVLQAEVYAYQALTRLFETLFHVRNNINPTLTTVGIAAGLTDRTALQDSVLETCREEYGALVFDTIIRRSARVSEFATLGISDSRKDQKASLSVYDQLLDELLGRISDGFSDPTIYARALQNRLYYVQEKLKEPLPAVKMQRFEAIQADLIENLSIARRWIS